MGAWAPRFKSIQGRRYDYDGSEFYWQYRIAERMGIPIPFAPAGFDESGFKPMNSGCFEGMFIHRSIVPRVSHEGLAFDSSNSLYFIDEFNGGSLYKYAVLITNTDCKTINFEFAHVPNRLITESLRYPVTPCA